MLIILYPIAYTINYLILMGVGDVYSQMKHLPCKLLHVNYQNFVDNLLYFTGKSMTNLDLFLWQFSNNEKTCTD